MADRGAERRRHRRVKTELPLKITFDGKEILAQARNISYLGACVGTDEKVALGSEVSVSLEVSLYGRISCQGIVTRCDALQEGETLRYSIAIFFRSFVRDDGKKLSKYIERVVQQEQKSWKHWHKRWKTKAAKKEKKPWFHWPWISHIVISLYCYIVINY